MPARIDDGIAKCGFAKPFAIQTEAVPVAMQGRDVFVLSLGWLVLIAFAWNRRNSGDLTAETGVGYALGIIGSTLMLIMLVYPLRKRLPAASLPCPRIMGQSWSRPS